MPTTKEVQAKRATRLKRQRRHYTMADMGAACRYCKLRVPRALNDAGIWAHPTCGPNGIDEP